MLVVPNQGEVLQLAAVLAQTPTVAPLTLRLYVNSHQPASGDTEADYLEASGGGYAAVALDASLWAITPGAPTVALYPAQAFVFSGALDLAATVRGYFVTDGNGALVWAERMPTPLQPQNAGDRVTITPRFTFASASGD